MSYRVKKSDYEYICCPQCGRHLMNSDLILTADLSSEIIACENCWGLEQSESLFPMSVREYVEQGYYSYVDSAIDKIKEEW